MMISLVYNHINLRMYVFLLPLNEPFEQDSSAESAMLHRLFLTVARTDKPNADSTNTDYRGPFTFPVGEDEARGIQIVDM